MSRALVLAAALLAFPATADAARFAVGIAPGADAAAVAQRVEERTGGTVELLGPFAVVLEAPRVPEVRGVRGVAFVERLNRPRRLAFTPSDPFAPRQWHLDAVHAFDAWVQRPSLPAMRVAVIDSGIDANHPEFRGRILRARSFVGGSVRDTHGHGTFVAGLMAASLNNGEGIAGMAFPAQLLVAKVVRSDGVVPLEAEARAIRWAADNNASVINLSLGGIRHPNDASRDSYSPLEASAVEYAIRKGAIVVAAVGNSDGAPEQPWRFASYPAALPHVLGVSALARDGSVPTFSNRDPIYNDIAAPGDELFSTLPRSLTALRPTCQEQGYSECGPPEFRRAQGTSFAAAIASAGTALVRASWPNLRPTQIVRLIERSAVDLTPETGCRRCVEGRDPISGWGRLDVAAAVNFPASRIPPRDRFEPNDDAGARARRTRKQTIVASVDFWDDQNDVYAIRLRRRGRIVATLRGRFGSNADLALWRPGTRRLSVARSLNMIRSSSRPRGENDIIRLTARRPGTYYLQVKSTEPGLTAYTLRVVRR